MRGAQIMPIRPRTISHHVPAGGVAPPSKPRPNAPSVRNTHTNRLPAAHPITSTVATPRPIRMCTAVSFSGRSERRHTAHEHLVEGRIYYRFHPRCGETVLIRRQLEHRGVVLVVILQPDSSLACIPLWMTHEAAAQYTLSEKPHFSVDILRSLRAEINALLGFLQPESKAEEADNVAPIQRSPTKPVRGERGAPSCVGDRTNGRGRGIGGNSSARDRNSAGKLGGQR